MTEKRPSRPGASAGNEPAGYPVRRPTADPHRFLIPSDQLPSGFAEKLDGVIESPVTPRPAATVVLVRDTDGGAEVLLLRRHDRSGFAADAWVFPGGTVDVADRDPALPVLCDGPRPAEWAEALGVKDAEEAFGYVVAAVRETFEETGILLASPRVTRESPSRPADAAELADYRGSVLAGRIGLREVAVNAGVQIATDRLTYIAHWITPEPEPRRYDTRFFLAPVPPGAEHLLHEAEMVEARWMSAGEAVERFRSGEMKMLPPTVHTLRELAGFATVAEMRKGLGGRRVPAILPRMRRHPEGVTIEFGDAL